MTFAKAGSLLEALNVKSQTWHDVQVQHDLEQYQPHAKTPLTASSKGGFNTQLPDGY